VINQSPLLLKFHKRWGIARRNRRNVYIDGRRLHA